MATWGGSPSFRDWTEDEKKNLFDITKLLVELGSDVNSAGEHGWTALHGAAYKGVGRSPVSRRTRRTDGRVRRVQILDLFYKQQ